MHLMVLLVALLCITTGHRAIFSTKTVKTKEHLNVTLQCHLDPRVNLVHYTFFCDRADRLRLVCRHRPDNPGSQLHLYSDKITLVHEDLKSGVLSLRISSVQLSDTGPYRCYVPGLRAGCITKLIVEKRDMPSTTKPPLDPVTEPDHPEVCRKDEEEEENKKKKEEEEEKKKKKKKKEEEENKKKKKEEEENKKKEEENKKKKKEEQEENKKKKKEEEEEGHFCNII